MVDNVYKLGQLKKMDFGRLTVLDELPAKVYSYPGRVAKYRMMLCRCECGAEVSVSLNNLVRGHTRSCGCYKREYAVQFLKGYTSSMVESLDQENSRIFNKTNYSETSCNNV